MGKTGEERIKRILEQNRTPEIKQENVTELKREMERRADLILCDILPPESFLDSLLRQVPYISPWVWSVQFLALVLFAAIFRTDLGNMEVMLFLSFLGPLLALLPAVDIVRRFSCRMWEMEAACRHDLRQLTAMHMCIIGGADIAVLATGACLCGNLRGSLWEFVLFVVLPFLVSSCVYLWELRHFSRRQNSSILAATGIGFMTAGPPILQSLHENIRAGGPAWMPGFLVCLTAILCVVTGYNAFRLCDGLKRGDIGYET